MGGAPLPSITPLTVDVNVPRGNTRLTFRIDYGGPGSPSDAEAAFQIVNPWWEAQLVSAEPHG